MTYQGIVNKNPPMKAMTISHGENPNPMANTPQRAAKHMAFAVFGPVMGPIIAHNAREAHLGI